MKPRLHILLAKDSPQAIVIRRGPSDHIAVIGWDRRTDTFTVGQWLKGNIYHFRSDISPNGNNWIYFAMKKGKPFTAVARTPYLKAEDFYAQCDTWDGGGLFLDNDSYWLNGTLDYTLYEKHEKTTSFRVTSEWPGRGVTRINGGPGVYFLRLLRDGWMNICGDTDWQPHNTFRFAKPAGELWTLIKTFHSTMQPPAGRGCYYEEHTLYNNSTGLIIDMPDWEWADTDSDRLVWAAQGNVMAGFMDEHGIRDVSLLFDTAPLTFTELSAPY